MISTQNFTRDGKKLPATLRRTAKSAELFKKRSSKSADQQALADWVFGYFDDDTEAKAPEFLSAGQGPAYAALRSQGALIADAWGPEGSHLESLQAALQQARADLDEEGLRAIDAVQIDLARDFEPVDVAHWEAAFSNLDCFLYGVELKRDGKVMRAAPSQMQAYNFTVENQIGVFRVDLKLDEPSFLKGLEMRRFGAESYLVQFGPPRRAVKLFRGDSVVKPAAVTQENVMACANMAADYLIRHVHKNGRMTYLWLSDVGDEPQGVDNDLRQWMGTIALIQVALWSNDRKLLDLAARNIDYNLRTFYKDRRSLGLIEYRGMVKLGSVALAAQALALHPDRDRWMQQGVALLRCVESFANDDGSFVCLWYPDDGTVESMSHMQNFYPGEAMLLWAQLYAATEDSQLRMKLSRSCKWYEKFFRMDRRPAFVPWQTRARCTLYAKTQDRDLAPFVFEMNDWLVDNMLRWDDAPHPDQRGMFFDPQHLAWGPPHAASDGVFLESLVDAFRLASALGDDHRAGKYRTAIARGLRNVMQLQFVDEVDMFFAADRKATAGGIRTSTGNANIRVDNVQHCLMAMLEILRSFEPDDYKLVEPGDGKSAKKKKTKK